nr:chorismate mutase [Bacillus pseudomycoides]
MHVFRKRLGRLYLLPVMCVKEIDVPNALQKCIRVMMTVTTRQLQHEVECMHVEKAIVLRSDLVK